MARTVRNAKLESPASRLKLSKSNYHWRDTGIQGLALGYWRGEKTSTWIARVLLPNGRYTTPKLGTADDYHTANGVDVLEYFQASAKAKTTRDDVLDNPGKPYTVREAMADYMAWFRQHRRSAKATETAINAHILPTLGEQIVPKLTTKTLTDWRDRLATKSARVRTGKLAKRQNYKPAPRTDDELRGRRATANRVLNVLKAALNKSFADGKVSDDKVWRRVKPFQKANEARIRFLSDEEGVRLVNACAPDLRQLVQSALLTGARYGELSAMRVQDVDMAAARVYIARSKSGRPRHVPLNPEGVRLLRAVTTGKTGDELAFTRTDGSAWGRNYAVRPLAAACKAAKIKPTLAFHELRHTYASHLAQAGVDLLTISKLLGHADTRITGKHYAHLADKTLAAAVIKLPSFGRIDRAKVIALR